MKFNIGPLNDSRSKILPTYNYLYDDIKVQIEFWFQVWSFKDWIQCIIKNAPIKSQNDVEIDCASKSIDSPKCDETALFPDGKKPEGC